MVSFLRINFLLLLLSIPLTAQASSQNNPHKNISQATTTPTILFASAKINKQTAARIAQQYVPGRVLTVSFDGSVYRVKIISQSGDVVSVFVDGTTGRILN